MSNEACMKYGAFPERLFIVHEKKIAFLCGQGPFDYDLEGVEKWLKEFKTNSE